jgi:hypothetical protein
MMTKLASYCLNEETSQLNVYFDYQSFLFSSKYVYFVEFVQLGLSKNADNIYFSNLNEAV